MGLAGGAAAGDGTPVPRNQLSVSDEETAWPGGELAVDLVMDGVSDGPGRNGVGVGVALLDPETDWLGATGEKLPEPVSAGGTAIPATPVGREYDTEEAPGLEPVTDGWAGEGVGVPPGTGAPGGLATVGKRPLPASPVPGGLAVGNVPELVNPPDTL
jgi:hypothetical protein